MKARVLFYIDDLTGADYVSPALSGHAVTRASSWRDFDRTLDGGSFDLVIALDHLSKDQMPDLQILTNYIDRRGGRAILRDWQRNDAYAGLFGAYYTDSADKSQIHISEREVADGIASSLSLSNPGWKHNWSHGIKPRVNSLTLGNFVENGDSCMVAANSGRTVILGFDADTMPARYATRFFENLINYVLTRVPKITVSPAEIDFGKQLIGSPASTKRVTVYSVGNWEIEIELIALSGSADFSIVDDDCSDQDIRPNNSREFGVQFNPQTKGLQEAVVTVPSNDPENKNLKLNVRGIAAIGKPQISVEPTVYDFGSVELKSNKHQSFTVTNKGDENLLLGRLLLSGPDAAEFSIVEDECSGQTLLPDASRTFQVSFAPTIKGDKSAMLSVPSNDPQTPDLQIALAGAGTPRPKIAVIPATHEFGHVLLGETSPPQPFTVTNEGTGDLILSLLSLEGEAASEFRIERDECSGVTLPPGDSRTFELIFAPTSKEEKSIKIIIPSDDPETPSLEVAISGNGVPDEPDISCQPLGADFGAVPAGKAGFQTLTIRNSGAHDLLIGSIALSGEQGADFSVIKDSCSGQTLSGPEGTCVVEVQFSPTTHGSKSATLDIQSNDPDTPSLQVGLLGRSGDPRVAVEPALWDFGSVSIGNSRYYYFYVRNIGQGEIKIGRLSLAGASASEFRIDNDSCSGEVLGPGTSRNFYVYFSPQSIGLKQVAVSISFVSPQMPAIDVSLKGTGHDQAIPMIEVGPRERIFDATEVNYPTQANPWLSMIVVSNQGAKSQLKIGAISITGEHAEDFRLEQDECSGRTMEGNSNGSFLAIFAPKSEGRKTATVLIPSNDPAQPIAEVSLKGEALPEIGTLYCNSLDVNLDSMIYNFRRDKKQLLYDPKAQCGDDVDMYRLHSGDAYRIVGKCQNGAEIAAITYGECIALPLSSGVASVNEQVAAEESRADAPQTTAIIIYGSDTEEDFICHSGDLALSVCQRWGFRCRSIYNLIATPLNQAKLENQILFFTKDVGPEDFLLIWYVGHGSGGDWTFAIWDNFNYSKRSAFELLLKKTQARDIVIINDGCTSGGFSRALHDWFDGEPADREALKGRRFSHFHCSGDLESGFGFTSRRDTPGGGTIYGLSYTNHLLRAFVDTKPLADPLDAWRQFRSIAWVASVDTVLTSVDRRFFKKIQHPGFGMVTAGETRLLDKKEFMVFKEDLGDEYFNWMLLIVRQKNIRLEDQVHLHISVKTIAGKIEHIYTRVSILDGQAEKALHLTGAPNEEIIPDSVTVEVYYWPY